MKFTVLKDFTKSKTTPLEYSPFVKCCMNFFHSLKLPWKWSVLTWSHTSSYLIVFNYLCQLSISRWYNFLCKVQPPRGPTSMLQVLPSSEEYQFPKARKCACPTSHTPCYIIQGSRHHWPSPSHSPHPRSSYLCLTKPIHESLPSLRQTNRNERQKLTSHLSTGNTRNWHIWNKL